MAEKNKPFDCVEMKRKAQVKLRAEYEARKGEFSSYVEFLQAKVKESEWQRTFWEEVRRAHAEG